ncbi:MAG: cytochrome c biogenesis protein ResB [Spirochaetia bacterium]
MNNALKKTLKTLSSPGAAFFFVTILIVMLIPLGLIPQNRSSDYYEFAYGPGAASVLELLMLDRVLQAPYFLVALGVFCMNLLICTAARNSMAARLRAMGANPLRKVPAELFHVGVLFFAAGLMVNGVFGDSRVFPAREGAEIQIGEQDNFRVTGLREVENREGVLIDWEVDLSFQGIGNTVSMNAPVLLDEGRIFLYSFSEVNTAVLETSNSGSRVLSPGEGFRSSAAEYALLRVNTDSGTDAAVFSITTEQGRREEQVLPGGPVGPFLLTGIERRTQVLLLYSCKPGNWAFWVGAVFFAAGSLLIILRIGMSKKKE